MKIGETPFMDFTFDFAPVCWALKEEAVSFTVPYGQLSQFQFAKLGIEGLESHIQMHRIMC